MKLLQLLVHLLTSAAMMAFAFTDEEILDQINDLHDSEAYLEKSVLNDDMSYQAKAAAITSSVLKDDDTIEEKHVTNFYVLACIYHATNEVSNSEIELPSPWYNATSWLREKDYCRWLGITCHNEDEIECSDISDAASLFMTDLTDTDDRVLGICLSDNDMTGHWPAETGLLGGYLSLLAVDYNYHLVALPPYDWFSSMTGLKQLYAGASSWDAPGIPTALNRLTKLEYFDVAYSFWSEGPIRGEAFAGLDNLKYIDIGDNFYDWMGDEASTVPDEFITLPNLIRLYMDNVIFVEPTTFDQYNMTLGFLERMDTLVEAWFDRTRLVGTLPTLPVSLKSLSLMGCGIWGNLNEIRRGDARLNRLWLNGNQLTGTLPPNLGGRMSCSHDLPCRLHLEGNQFTGPVPPALCNRYFQVENNIGQFEVLAGDTEQCEDSCCTCTGFECGFFDELSGYPVFPPKPVPAPSPAGFGLCFSGATLVETQNRGSLRMDQLDIGDYVLSDTSGKYEAVYSFGHKSREISAEFLQITTEGSHVPLEISPDHMIVTEDGRFIPASKVKTGDRLLTSSMHEQVVPVTSIKAVTGKGIYAPFTASGTIVVNGILASNYIAYQGSESYTTIAGIPLLSYQWAAHTFNSVHRLAVLLGVGGETYTESGVSRWVEKPHQWTMWLLEQPSIVSMFLLFVCLVITGLARLVEMVVINITSTVAGLLMILIMSRYYQNNQQKKKSVGGEEAMVQFI